MSKLKLLVTGAGGFVGRALSSVAIARGVAVRGATRTLCDLPTGVKSIVVGNIDDSTEWQDALNDCDFVVHLAARVHVTTDITANPLSEFCLVNVHGTLNLAQQAAAAGVRRFVFVSSIKVNGESTQLGSPFRADDAPAPLNAYGMSKMDAEQGLIDIAFKTGMEVVIIRPPLVYGPGVKANFAAMMRWVHRGVPLPLSAINNQRSLVALDNLVDLIITCVSHPKAANQIFLAGDGKDLSTPQLLRLLGLEIHKPARLFPVPAAVLRAGATLLGKQELARQVLGSLQVDISKTRALLDWSPPITVEEGMRRVAQNFLNGLHT